MSADIIALTDSYERVEDDHLSDSWLQHMRAKRAAIRQENREPWAFVPLDDYLEGRIVHEPPTILLRADGHALFYPRKRHLLVGSGESLKTWMVFMAGIQVMQAGGTYLAVDFENSPDETIERLCALGVSKSMLRQNFRLIAPDEGMTRTQAEIFEKSVADIRPAFASIDSVGAGMGLHDYDPNDALDWYKFRDLVVGPVFRATSGAVVAIDHRAKDQQQRTAIGTVAKRNSFDVEVLVEAVSPFGRGMTGTSNIHVGKDRAGHLRAHAKDGKFFGTLRMTANAAGTEVTASIDPSSDIMPENAEAFVQTQQRAAVLKIMEQDPDRAWSPAEIRLRMNWGKTLAAEVMAALVYAKAVRRTGAGRGIAYWLERNRPQSGPNDSSASANSLNSTQVPDGIVRESSAIVRMNDKAKQEESSAIVRGATSPRDADDSDGTGTIELGHFGATADLGRSQPVYTVGPAEAEF